MIQALRAQPTLIEGDTRSLRWLLDPQAAAFVFVTFSGTFTWKGSYFLHSALRVGLDQTDRDSRSESGVDESWKHWSPTTPADMLGCKAKTEWIRLKKKKRWQWKIEGNKDRRSLLCSTVLSQWHVSSQKSSLIGFVLLVGEGTWSWGQCAYCIH